MEKRLEELIAKEIVKLEELEEIQAMEEVKEVEDNGMSGYKVGCHLYTVRTEEEEFEIYTE